MRQILLLSVLAAAIAAPKNARAVEFDWQAWQSLVVQNGGRQKPLDTLAWEWLRLIANRASFVDPQSKAELAPAAAYLAMFFDYRGLEHLDKQHLQLVTDWRPLYFHLHEPDKWDRAPLFRVDYPGLKSALKMADNAKHTTAVQIDRAKILDELTGRDIPFTAWAEKLSLRAEAGEELTELEQKGLELADRYWLYQNHRMGRGMEVAPIAEDPERKWLPVALLILTKFDEESDPTGRLKMAQTALLKARDAYRQGDTNAFNLASAEFSARLRAYGEAAGTYPTATVMSMEVLYNRWAPFRIAWILLLSASLAMLLHFGSRWQLLLYAGVASYVSGVAAVLLGFGLRIAISGRPPVTNMYESVVYVGSGVACFGLLFEWIYRKQYTLTAAAVVSTVALVLADNCPLVLDPSVKPLEPVLRSNFWLVTHVMTITLSYAAFALALGIANITLGYFLARSQNKAVIAALSRFTYKALQVGVLLLATGTILGGVWADYSWGRFWGWDPKEVWALIALLGYLAVLHARFAGWVGHRGLATMSVVCFSLVVMAWYGVNFVLGTGLHSYGFGGGGQSYVYAAVVLQFLFMGVALWRSHIDEEEKLGASLPRVCSAEG